MAWGGKSGGPAGASGSGGSLSFIGSEVTITGNISGKGNLHLESDIVIKKVSSMPKRKWIKPVIGANTVVEAPEGLFKNIEENEMVLFDAL